MTEEQYREMLAAYMLGAMERFDAMTAERVKQIAKVGNNGNNGKEQAKRQIAMPWVREERGYDYGLYWHDLARTRRVEHLS